MKDKYRVTNADICIRCDLIQYQDFKTYGLRWNVCNACGKKLKEEMKNWNKNGLYAVKKQ